jgi:1-acyl-sn-glycerol-3-phosphate acyltransferase
MSQVRARPPGRLFSALGGKLRGGHGDSPSSYDARTVARAVEAVGHLFGPGAWFDLDVRGFDLLPPAPVLLVSNHSGGTSIPDVWGFAVAWYRHFGLTRPLHVMAHELLFASSRSGRFFERCGVLRATPQAAHQVLVDFKRDLLVMPGGDRDTWRPWTERYRVHFGGNTGYARLASEAQVPIVPVAHAGAHETLMVLSSGERLARWLGLRSVARARVWPVHLSLPWGLAIGPWPHLPVPARFRYLLGAPIAPHPPVAGEPEVRELDSQVRAAVQAQLDVLAAEPRQRRRWAPSWRR